MDLPKGYRVPADLIPKTLQERTRDGRDAAYHDWVWKPDRDHEIHVR